MKKYEELIKTINLKNEWVSDEDFFKDVLVKSSIRLLEYCYADIDQSVIVRIFPILRQVQENYVVLLGLSTGGLTAKEFAEEKINPKKIFRHLFNKSIDEQAKTQWVDDYIKGTKDILNKYSHTSLDGLMFLFMDEYQTFESMKFMKMVAKLLIALIELVFIPMINHLYKTKIAIPSLDFIKSDLKIVGSLRYTADKLPDGYKKFLASSPILSSYYKNIMSNFKELTNLSKFDSSKTDSSSFDRMLKFK